MNFIYLTWRDYKLATRQVQSYMPLALFVLSALFIHWTSGGDEAGLAPYVPGLLLFFLFLNLFFATDMLYSEDYRSGFLLHYYLMQQSLQRFVFARFVSQWFIMCLPLVLISPLLAITLGVHENVLWLVPANGLATLILSAFITLHSLLVIGNTQGRSLLSLLTMPFIIPPFIIVALFYQSLATGSPCIDFLYILLGGCLISIPLCLKLGAWGLKTALWEHVA